MIHDIDCQCFLVGEKMIKTAFSRRRQLAEFINSDNIVPADEKPRHRDVDDEFPSIRFPWHTLMISAFPGVRG